MAVYVDNARIPYGRMKMSHMLADTLEELHAMADKIGVARRHFQPGSTPHYDVCQAKACDAVLAGAVVVNRRQLVTVIRRLRTERMRTELGKTGESR